MRKAFHGSVQISYFLAGDFLQATFSRSAHLVISLHLLAETSVAGAAPCKAVSVTPSAFEGIR